ncbi:MAG TPA: amidohydrolase family protein [Candidatus Dormibacteraeota bacterium]|jgi:predicted TIM-barrel fold metal-dependent hydrolase|nr:amidohydrolase family protein [Candidatus Dormibacteraeota bacterium]
MTKDSKRDYRLISADGHFNEPGDLWTSRVSAKYRDKAPRIESFEQGDAWVFPGYENQPVPFAWGACAHRRPEDQGPWCRFDEVNPGSYDPAARVREMDEDGVDAELLFPSGATNTYVASAEDPELHHELVRAYNDWVSEFCGHAPERLGGTALIPNRGVEGALREMERCLELPGFVGWLLKCYPHGDTNGIPPEDDPVWALVQESRMPLTIHIGLGATMSGRMSRLKAEDLPGTVHFMDAPTRMLQFIFSGVLDRFPDMRVPLIEVDCGWLPYFADQADDNFSRHRKSSLRNHKLTRMPSEYMRDFFPAAFITDPYAIENRHRVGVERMMWSNDYPHITSDWPNSWKTINATFHDVPRDERQAILAGNAQRLFRFDEKQRSGAASKPELAAATA